MKCKHPFCNKFIHTDQYTKWDYIPVIGNISAITRITAKAFLSLGLLNTTAKREVFYTRYNYSRLIVLSVPLLGNIAIGLYDAIFNPKMTKPSILQKISEAKKFDLFHLRYDFLNDSDIVYDYFNAFHASTPSEEDSVFFKRLEGSIEKKTYDEFLSKLGYSHKNEALFDKIHGKGAYRDKKEEILRQGLSLADFIKEKYFFLDIQILKKVYVATETTKDQFDDILHKQDVFSESNFYFEFLNTAVAYYKEKGTYDTIRFRLLHSCCKSKGKHTSIEDCEAFFKRLEKIPFMKFILGTSTLLKDPIFKNIFRDLFLTDFYNFAKEPDFLQSIRTHDPAISPEKEKNIEFLRDADLSSRESLLNFFDITNDPTIDNLNRSYRRLCLKFHPDKNPQELSKVYETLFDKLKKAHEAMQGLLELKNA